MGEFGPRDAREREPFLVFFFYDMAFTSIRLCGEPHTFQQPVSSWGPHELSNNSCRLGSCPRIPSQGRKKAHRKFPFSHKSPNISALLPPPQAGHLRSGTLKQFYFFFFLSTIGNFNDTDITFPHHYLTESFLFSSSVSVFLWVPDLPRFMGKKC